MKKMSFFPLFVLFVLFTPACQRGTGCPSMNTAPKLGKDNLPKKPAKSRLFSKKSKIPYYRNQQSIMY